MVVTQVSSTYVDVLFQVLNSVRSCVQARRTAALPPFQTSSRRLTEPPRHLTAPPILNDSVQSMARCVFVFVTIHTRHDLDVLHTTARPHGRDNLVLFRRHRRSRKWPVSQRRRDRVIERNAVRPRLSRDVSVRDQRGRNADPGRQHSTSSSYTYYPVSLDMCGHRCGIPRRRADSTSTREAASRTCSPHPRGRRRPWTIT